MVNNDNFMLQNRAKGANYVGSACFLREMRENYARARNYASTI